MSTPDQTLDTCGCCDAGPEPTPLSLENRPGLNRLIYRVGDHASFKAAMLRAIHSQPIADQFTTREDNDPTIALFDAAATMLDVLTFYQERIANEGYLGTSLELRSVLELAHAIGYELNPGVAASAPLAFTMQSSPGAPESAVIPTGSKIMSIPGQDEHPQTFETIEEITARPEWNALRPIQTAWDAPAFNDTRLFFQGTGLNLKPGDLVILVGQERQADPTSERWDARRLVKIREHMAAPGAAALTEVTLERGLGKPFPHVLPAAEGPRAYVMRQRANLFGYNAPNWKILLPAVREAYKAGSTGASEWPGLTIGEIDTTNSGAADQFYIHLDNVYPAIQRGSWILLSTPDYDELYRILEASESSRSLFGMSARTHRLRIEGENLEQKFNQAVRETSVFVISEELPLAERPLQEPLGGDRLVLSQTTALPPGQKLLLSGRRIRLKLDPTASNYSLNPAGKSAPIPLYPGESLIVLSPPQDHSASSKTWTLQHNSGVSGTLLIPNNRVDYVEADEKDPLVSELAIVMAAAVLNQDDVPADITWRLRAPDPTMALDPGEKRLRVDLTAPLERLYDRATLTINANVAMSTHGDTKGEIAGSGNASKVFQKFTLKNKLLTYVPAPTPSGGASTLEVRVDKILWKEIPSLYNAGPRDRVFITRIADDGAVTVLFGDGEHGARLPTGSDNVHLDYRVGAGSTGMLRTGQLSLLTSRPLGVQGVNNPLSTSGAADPETTEQARQNAPFTVLTLDRIVSLQDFEDFAHAFSGIGKAQAADLWFRNRRVLHLTVAAGVPAQTDQGEDYTISPASLLYQNLVTAIAAARDDTIPVNIDTYQPVFFELAARLLIDPAYLPEDVQAAAEAALQTAFSFSKRGFGQPVYASEVDTVLQNLNGVQAVFLKKLCLQGQNGVHASLISQRALLDKDGLHRAQLLLLDPAGIELEVIKA